MNQSTHDEWKATGTIIVGAVTLGLLVGVLGYWGVEARIAGAVIASGTIQVETNRQVVQHPEGGVVGAIYVKDGDPVAAGDVVLRLDDRQLRSELAIIEGQLFEVLARKARLQAERDGLTDLTVSEDLRVFAQEYPEIKKLIEGQRRLFEVRADTLRHNTEQLSEQISQTENQIDGSRAQLGALERQQTLIVDELSDSSTLFEKGLAPAARVSALQREDARIMGEIGSIRATIAQLSGQIAALEIQKVALTTRLREEAVSTLRDLQIQEVELVQRRLSMMQTLSKTDVRAPVDGIVFGLRVFALQSVINRADPIMYIIPQGQQLVVSARVEPIHVDQIKIGQTATLRFAAFDQRLTPEITGLVTNLSADVLVDEASGAAYFQVELIPAEGEVLKLGDQTLLPGMPVEAFIKTGDRSPLSYLTKPLTDYFTRSFREA
ncbi:HlyD family type I secretion periplasmic adaptor subunit [uncultured Ruegeria sp.]|uniref:HlyD family type I secretion periplasmic adaptor subunit n=1 Tax=uncultured Ruegeria sp. TaxID=259304 RepID=UPI00262EFB53|nr:HlyD family type I secretion periplasmic adaptor subunit [uncultured Ruegeria sp.]